MLLANICLACGPWAVRLAETESLIGPLASAFWRIALAVPLLAAAAWAREPAPRRAGWPMAAAIFGGVMFAADLGAWHVGILHTRLANASLLGNVTAILFPAYGFLVARHWPSRRQSAALLLAVAGAVLLLGRSYSLSAHGIVGDLLCIFAGLSYTLYLIAIGRTRGAMGPLTVLAISGAAATPGLLLLALATGEHVWPHDWTPLILMSLGSQIIGQGLILYAIGRVTPLVVGLMLLVQPVVTTLIGWVIYGERLGPPDLVGAVAIAAAVLLIRERRPLRAEA
ncbi:DMT family transporter [Sphingomonas nostoxanthinifaciens]|nr:DMT family transporter [Sphingomonas nostoxanthinifaciens]